MAFNSFKSLRAAAKESGLRVEQDHIFPPLPETEPDESLVRWLDWAYSRRKSGSGETFMREFFIAPVLHYAIRDFEYLNLWANDYALNYDEVFSGYPDYLVTGMRNPRAAEDPEQHPYLAVAEAKKDNFEEGWGQCLAELHACRSLNQDPQAPVWGIVATGESWQFGQLERGVFTRHALSVDLDPLGKLLAVLRYVFRQCDDAARRLAEAGE